MRLAWQWFLMSMATSNFKDSELAVDIHVLFEGVFISD